MAEEKIEKGVISEEALEEIAGGINVSKETLKKIAIDAGVIIASGAALIGGGYGLYKLGENRGENRGYQSGYNTAMGKHSRSSNRGVYFDPKFEEKNLPRLFGDEKYEQD